MIKDAYTTKFFNHPPPSPIAGQPAPLPSGQISGFWVGWGWEAELTFFMLVLPPPLAFLENTATMNSMHV